MDGEPLQELVDAIASRSVQIESMMPFTMKSYYGGSELRESS
jgi:hypothetical protein